MHAALNDDLLTSTFHRLWTLSLPMRTIHCISRIIDMVDMGWKLWMLRIVPCTTLSSRETSNDDVLPPMKVRVTEVHTRWSLELQA